MKTTRMKNRCVMLAAVLGLTIAMLGLAVGSAAGQVANANPTDPATLRTPWGQPNLQGIWDLHTITRLERPDEFAGREFLTAEEASALEQRARFETTDEARQENVDRDLGQAYNDFWWDRATTVVSTLRTSLIVDPVDGKVPVVSKNSIGPSRFERGRSVLSESRPSGGANLPPIFLHYGARFRPTAGEGEPVTAEMHRGLHSVRPSTWLAATPSIPLTSGAL